MNHILPKEFYDRSVLDVAPELLGKYLTGKAGRKPFSFMITEVEAYDGVNDLACHASKGRTARTEVMFSEAGVWYVYLIYGMYNMLNIVTSEREYPAAVLIRGVEGIDGPGRLTRVLGVTLDINALPATESTGLWIEDRGIIIDPETIRTTPRIGVEYAGEWATKPWRFLIGESHR